MRAQFHAAVSALFAAFLIILIAIFGLQFVATHAAGAAASYNVFAVPVWFLRTVFTILALGYTAGLIAWVAGFISGCSGVHRLAAARTWTGKH